MNSCLLYTSLTSQLARELTLGIQNEVEDAAELFKKMAIVKESDKMPEAKKTEEAVQNSVLPAYTVSEKLEEARMIAERLKHGKKTTAVQNRVIHEAVYEQISLFELAG